VASTAANSLAFLALPRANRKRLVAKTPEKRATRAVFRSCPVDGGGGLVTAMSSSQNGTDPSDSSRTLLNGFSRRGLSIAGRYL
jgi:hypothetical protein